MTKFGAVHILSWGKFRRGNPRWSGEVLFIESERLVGKLKEEMAAQFPDHQISWDGVTLELRLGYTVPDQGD